MPKLRLTEEELASLNLDGEAHLVDPESGMPIALPPVVPSLPVTRTDRFGRYRAGRLSAGPDESGKAFQACRDWLRLGPGRSLPALLQQYQNTKTLPPTRSLDTLKCWSRRFHWQERARAYDR